MNDLGLGGTPVTVVGLARSGIAACRVLAAQGAHVTGTDRSPRESLRAEVAELERLGVTIEAGGHRPASFAETGLIVLSPGVPTEMPLIQEARLRGVPVWGEVELAYRLTPARFLGITGTNGKSTTTTLLGAMLDAAGIRAVVAGNIGTALCDVVPSLGASDSVVAELSSFQLETILHFRPAVAVLLNLAPDHLDRYPDVEPYYAAKARIFMNQTPADTAVLNADDPLVLERAKSLRAQPRLFSRTRTVGDGAYIRNGILMVRRQGSAEQVCGVDAIRIQGLHNLENSLAAAAAAAAVGASAPAMAEALRTFPGLPHRLELIAEIAGVKYVNDSKGTNVGAVLKSLEGYRQGVILIAGGKDKGGDFRPLRPLVESRVKALILIGQARDAIATQLAGACPMEEAATLQDAIRRGMALGNPGDTVLLSPACASFDMFRDFEHRGEVFRQTVQDLARGAA
ncbi:MAG TPA: UDP-N-acetylmuramoyl-L-alanine--D-glutamate ligase [Candidatus Baltobacteraceae bacterium]|nr:UDP-N-acetylmuramoyl-L-alanine--D-glutamate ligase [Candidatus Baltobacteraceae bacterium]